MKASWLIAIPLMVGLLAACGGGGGGGGGGFVPIRTPTATPTPTPPAGNVQSISVDLGPNGNLINGVFTSVTVCIPNTVNCQTIPNVLLDTGSFGLRLLGSALTLALPRQTDAGGGTISECAFFGSFFTWGPVATADIEMSDEAASSVPVQIVSPSGFTGAPTACVNGGLPQADSLSTMRANGVLGVGVLVQDCGSDCTSDSSNGLYFTCTGSSCSGTTQSLANQVQNPISSFAGDNNGLIIELPSVPAGGAKSVTGSLVFGIGTESNNGLGSAQIFTTDSNGNVITTFGGNSYGTTFIDTGSNALFFLNTAATGIPECGGPELGFYCPNGTVNETAQIKGQNSATATIDFNIESAVALFSTNNAVFDDLGGVFPQGFDWGVPFFLGRNVFVAIDGQSTPGGSGPYFAF